MLVLSSLFIFLMKYFLCAIFGCNEFYDDKCFEMKGGLIMKFGKRVAIF